MVIIVHIYVHICKYVKKYIYNMNYIYIYKTMLKNPYAYPLIDLLAKKMKSSCSVQSGFLTQLCFNAVWVTWNPKTNIKIYFDCWHNCNFNVKCKCRQEKQGLRSCFTPKQPFTVVLNVLWTSKIYSFFYILFVTLW